MREDHFPPLFTYKPKQLTSVLISHGYTTHQSLPHSDNHNIGEI
jgi:hypothetical protein